MRVRVRVRVNVTSGHLRTRVFVHVCTLTEAAVVARVAEALERVLPVGQAEANVAGRVARV